MTFEVLEGIFFLAIFALGLKVSVFLQDPFGAGLYSFLWCLEGSLLWNPS